MTEDIEPQDILITKKNKRTKKPPKPKDVKITRWFQLLGSSEGTQIQYTRRMELFCHIAGKTPSELITEANAETRAGLFLNEMKSVDYIALFKDELKNRNYSPKATASAIAAIRSFYNAFDIPLSSSIGQIKKAYTLRQNRTFLKKEDIKKLIDNANNLRDRAIFLVMATSGMARKEIINLKVGNIFIDSDDIGTVTMRRQKNDIDFITFISPEAVQALRLYWDERARYKNGAFKIKNDEDYVFVTSFEGKKIETTSFSYIFRGMAKELGYQNDNGKGFQIKCKSHALRKFFSSTLEDTDFPRKKLEFMLAHSQSDNESAYYPKEIQKLKELYINYLPHITFDKEIKIVSLSTEDEKRLGELEEKTEIQGAVISSQGTVITSLLKTSQEMGKQMDGLLKERNIEAFGDNEVEVFDSEEDKKKKAEILKNLTVT